MSSIFAPPGAISPRLCVSDDTATNSESSFPSNGGKASEYYPPNNSASSACKSSFVDTSNSGTRERRANISPAQCGITLQDTTATKELSTALSQQPCRPVSHSNIQSSPNCSDDDDFKESSLRKQKSAMNAVTVTSKTPVTSASCAPSNKSMACKAVTSSKKSVPNQKMVSSKKSVPFKVIGSVDDFNRLPNDLRGQYSILQVTSSPRREAVSKMKTVRRLLPSDNEQGR